MTDATQHPLYRPHMGDMTGWRFLEGTEVIQSGDQYFSFDGSWYETNCTLEDGCTPNSEMLIYRRRISVDSPKPAIAEPEKRFVTVVFEVPQGVDVPNWLKADTTVNGLRCVAMGVGDAIKELDEIEDNVMAAIHKVRTEAV